MHRASHQVEVAAGAAQHPEREAGLVRQVGRRERVLREADGCELVGSEVHGEEDVALRACDDGGVDSQ